MRPRKAWPKTVEESGVTVGVIENEAGGHTLDTDQSTSADKATAWRV